MKIKITKERREDLACTGGFDDIVKAFDAAHEKRIKEALLAAQVDAIKIRNLYVDREKRVFEAEAGVYVMCWMFIAD